MSVSAIDPGPHCGVATRLGDGTIQHFMMHNDLTEVWRYLVATKPTAIVIERFVTAGRISTPGLRTVEVQGSMMSLAWLMDCKVYMQRPIDRYPFLETARTLIGANRTKIQSHSVDALAHLLCWEYREKRGEQRVPVVIP